MVYGQILPGCTWQLGYGIIILLAD